MKKIFFFLCCFLLSQQSFSQKTIPEPPPFDSSVNSNEGDKVFLKVEVEAAFPGGQNAWRAYLMKNLDAAVPVNNRAKKGIYKVVIKFIVGVNGKIRDVSAETNQGHGMEEEVMRIIKAGPDWIPARQNGRAVNAYRRQPVTFSVE